MNLKKIFFVLRFKTHLSSFPLFTSAGKNLIFVHINKTANVMCEYNYRFKKWVPIKVSNDRRIATQKDIRQALIQKS